MLIGCRPSSKRNCSEYLFRIYPQLILAYCHPSQETFSSLSMPLYAYKTLGLSMVLIYHSTSTFNWMFYVIAIKTSTNMYSEQFLLLDGRQPIFFLLPIQKSSNKFISVFCQFVDICYSKKHTPVLFHMPYTQFTSSRTKMKYIIHYYRQWFASAYSRASFALIIVLHVFWNHTGGTFYTFVIREQNEWKVPKHRFGVSWLGWQ
jgi:hypothetical protein